MENEGFQEKEKLFSKKVRRPEGDIAQLWNEDSQLISIYFNRTPAGTSVDFTNRRHKQLQFFC